MFERLEMLTAYWRARHGARFASRAALEQYQAKRLTRFMQKTLSHSAYYRPFAGQPLSAYPVMTKPVMLSNFGAINTAGISYDEAMAIAVKAEQTRDFAPRLPGGISVGLSTGTSGMRGLFLVSERERMRWAGIMLGRMLPGSLLAPHRIAFFLRANNNLYESVSGRLRIRFQFFDLMVPLADHHRTLQSFQPTILIAPAQVLRELARLETSAQSAGTVSIAPSKIISVGEVLFDDDRAAIEAAYGQRVDQVYQCTEGFLGYTCSAGRLHLNEAFLHVEPEWLDDAHTRFHPIVTDFSRQTQPIVRYRLDDVLSIDGSPCPCGSPERVIARIEGRADDILLFARPDGERIQVMPDYIVRALTGANSGMTDFKVEQPALNALHVMLKAEDFTRAQSHAEAALSELAQRLGVVIPPLTFAALPPTDAMSKRRRVVRNASIPL